eukprot:s5_g71.t1
MAKPDIPALRRHLAAPGRPDEGMRGTAADAARRSTVAAPELRAALAEALLTEAEDAAAASCLMGPAEAEALGPVVAIPLCQALALAATSSTRAWILFALVRLAQFSSCHQQLLDAGVVEQLATSATAEPGEGEAGTSGIWERPDVLAYHIMAFVSETGGWEVAELVPLQAIDEFDSCHLLQSWDERALAVRLQLSEAKAVVERKGFYGFPLYYRPRFILQAIAALCKVSARHAYYVQHSSNIPDIVRKLQAGRAWCGLGGSSEALGECKAMNHERLHVLHVMQLPNWFVRVGGRMLGPAKHFRAYEQLGMSESSVINEVPVDPPWPPRLDHALRKDSEAQWVICASENEICQCSSGHVRYGTFNKGWVTKKNKAQILCTLDKFSKTDMAYGMLKLCQCHDPPDRDTGFEALKEIQTVDGASEGSEGSEGGGETEGEKGPPGKLWASVRQLSAWLGKAEVGQLQVLARVYHLLEYTGNKAKVAAAIAKVVRKACREALVGGLEKILEKHHKRLVLDLQQWLEEHQAGHASEEGTAGNAGTGTSSVILSKPRESGYSDQSLGKRGEVSQLSSSQQVSIMSPSRVTNLDKLDYELAQKVSVMHRERQSRLSLESGPSAGPTRSRSSVRRLAAPETCRPCCRFLQRIISCGAFEAFFAVVIATNSLFIGITIEWEARERTFTLPSSLFVVIPRDPQGSPEISKEGNWFDLAIVVSAVFEVLVEIIAHDPQLSAGSSSNLRILRILRMTRLTRIFRVIRVVRFFRSLRTLVFSKLGASGLIVNTLKSLFWAMLLLALIM